MNNHNVIFSIN